MITITIFGLASVSILIYLIIIMNKNKHLQEQISNLERDVRSAYVKFGKSFEHFVPFIKNFPGDRNKTTFLGMPIDFISFDEDSIKFIEVKTGKSQLNNNQQRIKKLILDKKIEWHELNYGK